MYRRPRRWCCLETHHLWKEPSFSCSRMAAVWKSQRPIRLSYGKHDNKLQARSGTSVSQSPRCSARLAASGTATSSSQSKPLPDERAEGVTWGARKIIFARNLWARYGNEANQMPNPSESWKTAPIQSGMWCFFGDEPLMTLACRLHWLWMKSVRGDRQADIEEYNRIVRRTSSIAASPPVADHLTV